MHAFLPESSKAVGKVDRWVMFTRMSEHIRVAKSTNLQCEYRDPRTGLIQGYEEVDRLKGGDHLGRSRKRIGWLRYGPNERHRGGRCFSGVPSGERGYFTLQVTGRDVRNNCRCDLHLKRPHGPHNRSCWRAGQGMGKYEVVGVYINCLPGSKKGHLFRRDVGRVRRHHVDVHMIASMTWADEKQLNRPGNWLLKLRS